MALLPLRGGDPSRVGRFRLTARLGAGGMGVVYLGTAKDGTRVAVKVLRPELADDPEFRARFRREVAALTLVRGLCTVRVLEADAESAMPFLATEFADGPTLGEHVAGHGPLEPGTLHGLAAGLAEALTAIHGAGVIHRDLKPANVLLTQTGPKVIDFGIAQVADATAVTRTGMTVGSPGFMAPEQVAGQAGQPADIFAWALTIAYAASGRPPYGTGPADAVLYRVLHDSPDISAVPADLRPVIEAALARDPAARPTASQALGWLTGDADEADAGTRTQVLLSRTWVLPAPQSHLAKLPAGRRSRPRPRYLIGGVLAGAVVLGIGGGAGVAFLTGPDSQPRAANLPGTASHAPATHAPAASTPAALPATPVTSPSASAALLPSVTFGGYTGQKPTSIYLDVNTGAGIEDITWTSWTATTAIGEGLTASDDCTPDCATATGGQDPIELTLSDPVNGQFTRLREIGQATTVTMESDASNWPVGGNPFGSPACPTTDQVMTVWEATSSSARAAWDPNGVVAGIDHVQCWQDWVLATVYGSVGSTDFVFSQSGGLHLFPEADLQEFSESVCPSPQSPPDWKDPTYGMANCSG